MFAGRSVTESMSALVARGCLELPLPGGGATAARFQALSCFGALDLSLARLAEGHVDAVAILAEAGREARCGPVYGVWAATSPAARVVARRTGTGWRLVGRKQFCSGANAIERALVTADIDGGTRLFEVDCALRSVCPIAGTWPATGMAASNSLDVEFDDVDVPEADAVGGPGFLH
jgi:alkylation response protein AidB-like acyl-CoA dehydrogenase